jgi:hypothetical protein
MPVTYTNRKGIPYYLCQGMTKNGKVRYTFSRLPRDGAPDQIPEGYRISESVNGVVSLVLSRPPLIYAKELASVEAALARHPKRQDYRAVVKKNQIVIYERTSPDVDILSDLIGNITPLTQEAVQKRIQELVDKIARFEPVIRFILADPDERKFNAERWRFFGDVDDWIDTGEVGKIEKLARKLVPKLGTENFFDLF